MGGLSHLWPNSLPTNPESEGSDIGNHMLAGHGLGCANCNAEKSRMSLEPDSYIALVIVDRSANEIASGYCK